MNPSCTAQAKVCQRIVPGFDGQVREVRSFITATDRSRP
jgi:hypothetical protein